MIAARTKAALTVKKARDEKTGGSVPFGFRLRPDGVHLEPDPYEGPTLQHILELRREGKGGRKIAADLTAEGARPRAVSWIPGNLQVLADRWLSSEANLRAYGMIGEGITIRIFRNGIVVEETVFEM